LAGFSFSERLIEMRYARLLLVVVIVICFFALRTPPARAQSAVAKPPETVYLLKPAHVFDGEAAELHDDWLVLVHGEKIEAVGRANEIKAPADAKVIDLPGLTLMPGLIDAHSHVCFILTARQVGTIKWRAKL
jgi:hypothetical protein